MPFCLRSLLGLTLAASASAAWGQTATVRPAPRHNLPTHVDGNSSAFWVDGVLRLFTSTGDPLMLSEATSLFSFWNSQPVDVTKQQYRPLWMEAAWRDEDGTVFGWYHHEPGGVCGSSGLTAPKIGAAVSHDGGRSIQDLGIVLESGDRADCGAKNGFFATGHGDFSVVLDQSREYFYFLFTNYGGPVENQGVVIARLAFADRFSPAGKVQKFYRGLWEEPGLGGQTSPIFPARQAWQQSDADSFWGPSIHWNTHLGRYVILMNRSCCKPGWPQEGVYVTFSAEGRLDSWTQPKKLLSLSQIPIKPGYYPQVIGLEEDGTDTRAGKVARLYVMGSSDWELEFSAASDEAGETEPVPPETPPEERPLPEAAVPTRRPNGSGKRVP